MARQAGRPGRRRGGPARRGVSVGAASGMITILVCSGAPAGGCFVPSNEDAGSRLCHSDSTIAAGRPRMAAGPTFIDRQTSRVTLQSSLPSNGRPASSPSGLSIQRASAIRTCSSSAARCPPPVTQQARKLDCTNPSPIWAKVAKLKLLLPAQRADLEIGSREHATAAQPSRTSSRNGQTSSPRRIKWPAEFSTTARMVAYSSRTRAAVNE